MAEFAWKGNFLSTSSRLWNGRGRPRKIQEKLINKNESKIKISSKNISNKNFPKNEYTNICENLSILHSRSYINDNQLEAGCIFNLIAYSAKNSVMPTNQSGIAIIAKAVQNKCSSRSSKYIRYDCFISHKMEKNIKKYIRIRNLLIQESIWVEKIIDQIVVKDMMVNFDPKYDAMRNNLKLLKQGLNIIHQYFYGESA